MIFFSGDVAREKISKICGHFGATLYKYPETSEHGEMLTEVIKRIAESDEVMASGDSVLRGVLSAAAAAYPGWDYEVKKEKMVFDTLNMCEFDIKRHVFVAEGWVPKRDVDKYEPVVPPTPTKLHLPCPRDHRGDAALHETRAPQLINKLLDSRLTPPTYVPTTRFTSGFQALVNTYGTPRYREANPGAFAVILFPFLFGIMFGDFGHGLLLAALGGFLIKKEKDFEGQKMNDMLAMMYGGRYIILLNGLFGAYVGIMYNEAFAFPMNWFGGSRWYQRRPVRRRRQLPLERRRARGRLRDPPTRRAPDEPYPVGIDPIWHNTANKITFFNSYKMKISIVVGVIQMSVGIILSLLNHIEYKDWKCVFFRFIPECHDLPPRASSATSSSASSTSGPSTGTATSCVHLRQVDHQLDRRGRRRCSRCSSTCSWRPRRTSPSRSTASSAHVDRRHQRAVGRQVLDVCQSLSTKCPATCGVAVIGGARPLWIGATRTTSRRSCASPSPASVQNILLIAAFVAVPFLLIPIPIIELMQHNAEVAKRHEYEKLKEEGGDTEGWAATAMGGGGGHGHGDEFSFGDAAIHQGIHTIEFVLGAISNTASYLRLWALSLAHSQLAELFKDMILVENGFLFLAPSRGTASSSPGSASPSWACSRSSC